MMCWMLGGGVNEVETISPLSEGFWRNSVPALTLRWPSVSLTGRCREKQARLGRHFPRYRGRHAVFEAGGGLSNFSREDSEYLWNKVVLFEHHPI